MTKQQSSIGHVFLKLFWIGFALLAIVGIGVGYWQTGGADGQKLRELDRQIVSRMESIQNYVSSYARRHRKLPGTMTDLLNDKAFNYTRKSLEDPSTGDLFEYHPTSDNQYELCATFNTRYERGYGYSFPFYYRSYRYYSSVAHPKGYYCQSYYAHIPKDK